MRVSHMLTAHLRVICNITKPAKVLHRWESLSREKWNNFPNSAHRSTLFLRFSFIVMQHTRSHPGFTLMEIMLVLGIIGILAAIVITAINPTKQLSDAQGADRRLSVRELENAIVQYIIDGNVVAGVPNGIGSAMAICQDTATGATCAGAEGCDELWYHEF